MPEHEGWFFWFLRRFNTVVFAVIALVALIAMVVGLWRAVPAWRADIEREAMVRDTMARAQKLAADSMKEARAYHADPDVLQSSDTYYGPYHAAMVLERPMPPPKDVSPLDWSPDAYPSNQIANLMVFDDQTGAGHWLFAGTDRNIVTRDAVYQGAPTVTTPPGQDPRPLIGLVLCVVEKDTNKDGVLSPLDAVTVYVWHRGKKDVVKLLDADELPRVGQEGADRYLVVYRKGKALRSALYSVPDFELISDNAVPDAPK